MGPPLSYFERDDGLTFAYRILGENKRARPLVLITGLSAIGTLDWSPLDAALAKRRQVLVFDNRLVGDSTVKKEQAEAAGKFKLTDLAEDVVKLVQHVGWQDVDILGFSMGGMILQTLILLPSLPFKVSHLVLTATSAKNPKSDLIKAIRPPEKPRNEMTEQDLLDAVRPFLEVNFSPAWLADSKNDELFQRRLKEGALTRRPFPTIIAQSRAVGRYDVRDRLSTIPASLPVLIVHGEDDKSVYYSEVETLQKGIRHAELAKLPSTEFGHFWYDYFTTQTWVDVLEKFLDAPAAKL